MSRVKLHCQMQLFPTRSKMLFLKNGEVLKLVVQARLSVNMTDGGSLSLHWSAKTQLSAPQDLLLLYSYEILTVFQLSSLTTTCTSGIIVLRKSDKVEQVNSATQEQSTTLISSQGFMFVYSRRKASVVITKVNYTPINFQNYVNFISYIMLLTQLSVINVHLFSWIGTFCQANITCLQFRALQDQSIVFHKGAVIIQTLFWTPLSHLGKLKKKSSNFVF